MKILVVTPYFYPHTGGSERYIEELYGEMMQVDPAVTVDVLTYNTDKQAKTEQYHGFTIYRVGCIQLLPGQFALPDYIELIRLVRSLKVKRYDIVNTHTRFFDNSWWAVWLARYFKAQAVLTDHCAFHPNHPRWFVRAVARIVDWVAIPVMGRLYDRVFAVSEATKQFLVKNGMKRVEVVYGGVTSAVGPFKPDSGSIEPQITDPDAIIVSYIGRMIASKGPQLLLEAAVGMVRQNPHLYFLFAGDGELLPRLKQAAGTQIRFLGNIKRADVNRLLAASDMVVHPSMHHEGLPSVILEAGVAGKAVIATDRGGVKEIVEGGKTGLIVPPNPDSIRSAIEDLITDPSLRQRLGGRLHQKVVREFNWRRIAADYRDRLLAVQ